MRRNLNPSGISAELLRLAQLNLRPVRIRMHPANIGQLRALWRLPDGRFATDGSELYGLPLEADDSLADGEARIELSAGVGFARGEDD